MTHCSNGVNGHLVLRDIYQPSHTSNNPVRNIDWLLVVCETVLTHLASTLQVIIEVVQEYTEDE